MPERTEARRKRARCWARTIEEAGVRVRLYERERGGPIYREVRLDGRKDRKSLGHSDRALAVEQARALAKRLAELTLAGTTGGTTFGQLVAFYLRHRVPLLAPKRQRSVRGMIRLLERHFGRELVLDDLTVHHVQGYIAKRRNGTITAPRHRTPDRGVRAGTIRTELELLRTMLRWGREFRVNGRRLVAADPIATMPMPRELNPMRPVATEQRYQALLAVADKAERSGRFRVVLTLARETGRRITAICSLWASDVLLTREAVERALAAIGQPVSHAEHWPHGAIRWRAAHDKKGYETVAPLSSEARACLDAYLRAHPRAGTAPLLPGAADPSRPIRKEIAGYWLAKAERLAGLPHLARGGFHPFRRLWASERRHLPAQDVAAAGGWRSLKVMQDAYQHSDPATVYAVIEHPEARPNPPRDGHTLDTGGIHAAL